MTTPSGDLGEKLAQATGFVLNANHLMALSGAGLSVESGIPPYRGPGGLWTKYGEPPLLSYKEFAQDPRAWWESRLTGESEPGNPVYEMKIAVDRAKPNAGHRSLVEMERLGLLRSTVTQNVDNLHREAGSESVLEIHGNRTWLRCVQCGSRRPREGFELDGLPPLCPDCGGIIKIDTVMFGEPIPTDVLSACKQQAESCDCMLLVGTSGTVNPAASLPLIAKQRGAVLIEVNPEPTALTQWCDITLSGPSGEVLPLLLDRLRDARSG